MVSNYREELSNLSVFNKAIIQTLTLKTNSRLFVQSTNWNCTLLAFNFLYFNVTSLPQMENK